MPEASFITFRLPAYRAYLRKRLVKMPKLHFHDTGLECWLLGIRSPGQLCSHPLRGALFETWVVSEIAKHRTNRGEPGGLSFYRDRHAAEVDLIVESADRLTPEEAKAAPTALRDQFDGLRRAGERVTQPSRPCDAILVYGGEEDQTCTVAKLVPSTCLHREYR